MFLLLCQKRCNINGWWKCFVVLICIFTFDEERCNDFDLDAVNPFTTESLIICSLNWLETHPNRVEQALDAQFDCLIVDEAHHLVWSESAPSAAYLLVEQLARIIPSVLLLTATPEQLGQESHFARLRLLDPERFFDYQTFVKEQERYQPMVNAIESLLANKALSSVEKIVFLICCLNKMLSHF